MPIEQLWWWNDDRREHEPAPAMARAVDDSDAAADRIERPTSSNRRVRACPADLVRKAQTGSRRAFHSLWQRYAATVRAILLTMVDETEAEDLSQEVAVAAFRSLPSLQKRESFPAWLCTIARNMGRDALAAKARSHESPLEHAKEIAAPDAGDPAAADEILAQIRQLPECHREPLMLRLLLEMSGPEIAEQTGLTQGSVRVNLCRGMKLLRQRLRHWE